MRLLNNLAKKLGMPAGDSFTQDWIYELPEEFRTKEWLNKYIYSYTENRYDFFEKNELMALMLDIANDLLSQGVSGNNIVILNVLKLLSDNYNFHLSLIKDWSLDDEPLDDCFALTPKIRGITNANR